MQQKRKINNLPGFEASSAMFEREVSSVKRIKKFDWSLRPFTTKYIIDSSIIDDASSEEEWTPNKRARIKTTRSSKKRSKKIRSRKRKISKTKISVPKCKLVSANLISKVPDQFPVRRILPPNPSFPKHSLVPLGRCLLQNGLVV
jgi:hypothetical protein